MAIDTKLYTNKIKQNLWADKEYKIFYYNFKSGTKRYRGLIDLSNKAGWNKRDRTSFAESELLKIKSKKQNNIDDRVTLDKYMQMHFKLLPDTKWNNEKESFYENYIKDFLGKKFIKDIMPFHIKEVMKILTEKKIEQKDGSFKKLSERTIGRVLEVLKPAFKEAVQNRIIDHSPIEALTVKRPVTKKIVTNATDELVQIHNAICDEFENDPFYKALFFLALQGRRKNEILSLKWEDINFEKNFYILRQTKNNEEQKIFLPDDIKNLLSDIYESNNEYVFTSPVTGGKLQCTKRVVSRVRKRLDNDKFGLHYLRNVIVSAMAEQGLESIYLSGALGHNDPNTIKKYLTMNYLKSSEMASGVIAGIVNKG